MSRSLRFASCLCLALVTASCSKDVRKGTGGGLGPGQVSSSAQVVKVGAVPVNVSQSSPVDAVVTLSISPGFHVNANPATFSYLIATEVTAGEVDGIIVGTPAYPAAVKRKFQFAEEPLAVYEGEIPIKLNVRTAANATTGRKSLRVDVRVQACDEEQCFPPATIRSTIPVTVK